MLRTEQDYQQIIHVMKYARIKPNGHRETWEDTVLRFRRFMIKRMKLKGEPLRYFTEEVIPMILEKKVVPSMRLMASAGPAADRENLTAFNCMFVGIDSLSAFSRLMYALMCGTGVGFSVESQHINKLPKLPRLEKLQCGIPLVVDDSRYGWARALEEFIQSIWRGVVRFFDVSQVRPQGEPLRITGGYASGPKPLLELQDFIIRKVQGCFDAGETRMLDIDVYDICCKIADVVVQGGVRRSACLCLFDSDSRHMWTAKDPGIVSESPWRYNCNNTAVFPTANDLRANINKAIDCIKSGGEPGVVVRSALRTKAESSLRINLESLGLNPCAEVILRSNQVCNLTEVVLRPELSLEDNMNQVEAAVFLGLLQSQLTDYNLEFLHEVKTNSTMEPLLGVSLTGIVDDPELSSGEHGVAWLRTYAHQCTYRWCQALGISNIPTAVTTVKPSGTVSKLVGCSPGIHPRFARYYLSNIGFAKGTPLDKFLSDKGVPLRFSTGTMNIYSFPQKAPESALVADDTDVITQLAMWEFFNTHWCDHNVSCTVYVGPNEWDTVKDWLLRNADKLTGVTFLPKLDIGEASKTYDYMPLEAMTKESYEAVVASWPVLDFDEFRDSYDNQESNALREFACSGKGGACEIL